MNYYELKKMIAEEESRISSFVDNFELSVRANRAAREWGVKSYSDLFDLITADKSTLVEHGVRYFGEKSRGELVQILNNVREDRRAS